MKMYDICLPKQTNCDINNASAEKKCIEFCSPDNWLCGAQHILHIFVVCLCGFVQPDEMKKEMSAFHMISMKQNKEMKLLSYQQCVNAVSCLSVNSANILFCRQFE